MKQIDFNPSDCSVLKIRFKCPRCTRTIETDECSIPTPNDAIDVEKDPYKQSDASAICECGMKFNFTIWTNSSSGYIELNDEIDETHIQTNKIKGY